MASWFFEKSSAGWRNSWVKPATRVVETLRNEGHMVAWRDPNWASRDPDGNILVIDKEMSDTHLSSFLAMYPHYIGLVWPEAWEE